MSKVQFIEINIGEIIETHAIIDQGNGEFTSMTKAHYEELEAAKEVKADGNKL